MMEHEGKFCRIGSKLRFCHAAVLRQQAATKENGEGIMNIGYLESIFSFLGGLGMFLYGMSIMGDGMQKSAGSKLNKFLRMVTDNRLLAVGLGALITAILHSSGATTVMVVGFVNAGILNLTQAVGVIMGANIGTTITAWMVSLNSLGDAMKVLQPSFFAPLVVAIGAAFLMFSKKKKESLAGEICIGVGLLFVGLTFMSGFGSTVHGCPDLCEGVCGTRKEPDPRYSCRCPCNCDHPELHRFCRYLTDSGDEWSGIRKCRDLYYTWTEYRILSDCAFIQCRYKPQR